LFAAAFVVRRKYLIVVPTPIPAVPRRYMIVVLRPMPAAPRRYSIVVPRLIPAAARCYFIVRYAQAVARGGARCASQVLDCGD
jgi:hypothetical protein